MKFHRTKFFSENVFGIDSIQGLLELGKWYELGQVRFCFSTIEGELANKPLQALKQLQSEGYLTIRLSAPDDETATLESISLTIAGHKLLSELHERSASGKLKKRLSELVWVVITSIVTTIVVLWIKGT